MILNFSVVSVPIWSGEKNPVFGEFDPKKMEATQMADMFTSFWQKTSFSFGLNIGFFR